MIAAPTRRPALQIQLRDCNTDSSFLPSAHGLCVSCKPIIKCSRIQFNQLSRITHRIFRTFAFAGGSFQTERTDNGRESLPLMKNGLWPAELKEQTSFCKLSKYCAQLSSPLRVAPSAANPSNPTQNPISHVWKICNHCHETAPKTGQAALFKFIRSQ